MPLDKLLDDTKNGIQLNEKEIHQLAVELHLVLPKWLLFVKRLIAILLVLLSFYIFIKFEVMISLILLAAIVLLFFLAFRPKRKYDLIIRYIEAVKSFYLERFKEYKGFESIYIAHDYSKRGKLHNNFVLIFSDGYEFYIFDDLLMETDYNLPKKFCSKNVKRPVLKVFNSDYVYKEPVSFNVADIAFFSLNKHYEVDLKAKNCWGDEYCRYIYGGVESELKNYVWLELKNRMFFKFDAKSISFFRRKAIDKERTPLDNGGSK